MKQMFTRPLLGLFVNSFTIFLILFTATVASAQTSVDVARNYVNQNFALQKLTANDVAAMKVSSAYLSPTTGWHHVYFNQTYQSIEVYNALMNITLSNNQVEYVTHSFVANLETKINKEILKSNRIAPIQAIQNAATSVNLSAGNIQSIPSSLMTNGLDSNPNNLTFTDSNLSNENIEVSLYWIAAEVKDGEKVINPANLSLAWNVRFSTKDGNNSWNIHVDAISGLILKKHDDIVHCNFGTPEHLTTPHQCSNHILTTKQAIDNITAVVAPNNYNVFDYPLESPMHGNRTIVASPYTRFAPAGTGPGATNGWHDDGTTSYINTKGNNVDAKDDIANDNEGTVGSSPSSASLDFNYPYTFGTGTASGNLNAAVTNLFYWNNVLHDILYRYGFDEPSGNFQKNNMNKGGLGNDFVYADAQDGSGTNNANFQTPTDGGNGRMQMYIWSNGGSPTPYTPDSDFDNGIIAHEYGHGWSIRLTGGPANSSCLNNVEQGGEGWSDYAALMFTTNWSALTPTIASANLARGIGTYAITQPTTGAGIRPFKYSYDMANVNGAVTYAKVGDSNFSQPHGIGSIWATMLWDMTWEIILADNQIVSNIYNTPANITDMRGNIAALKLVNEGLRLQPCSPSFIDARNAILQADQMLFGGRYRCAIGRAFARRGLGANASTGVSSNDRIVTEDFTPISGPAITSSLNNTICSNTNFTYTATTASTGISFAWTRAAMAGISNPAASGNSANINETLINTTSNPITVIYSFILSPDPCGGTTSPQFIRVVVNPRIIPSIGSYSINQNESVPAGQGLAVSQNSSNTTNGTLSTTSPSYLRSSGGTVYSASTNTYYQTYSFVAASSSSMNFRTIAAILANCGSDTHMSIYQNSFNPSSPASNFLAADDDSGGNGLSSITLNVTQGTTYIIVVGTFCAYDTGTFTLQASSAVLSGGLSNWYLTPTGGTVLATSNVFNPVGVAGSGIPNTSIPGTYNFYVANANYPDCRTLTTFTIVPVQSVGGTVSSGSVCSVSNSGVVTLTGNVGNIIRWEISTDNFVTQRDEYNFSGNTLPYSNLTQTTQYRVVVQYQNLPPVLSSVGTITVGNTSVAGLVTPETSEVCLGANTGALLLTGYSGNVVNWESSTDNFVTKTTISNISNIQTYTNLTIQTKYRAVVKNGTCIQSNSLPATISIIPVTVGGSVTSSVTVCAAANSGTLTLSGTVGNVLRWESSNDNFTTKTDIANTTFSQQYSNLTQTTQYRAVVQSGSCTIVNSNAAVITVDATSLGGIVNTSTSVCANDNSGTLNLTGNRGSILRWESSSDNFITSTSITNTGTSQDFLNLTQTTGYRAVVKNGVCPTVNATPAIVSVVILPMMTAPTVTQPTCFQSGTIVVNAAVNNVLATQTINGSITTTDPLQTGRETRDGIPSVCGTPKSFVELWDSNSRYYDSYAFTNTTSIPQCVNATLNSIDNSKFFLMVYSGSFVPTNIATNFIADAGGSGNPMLSSQTVAPGATIVVVVHSIDTGVAPGAYTLTIGPNNTVPTTLEYSINSGNTWQNSNTFSGLIGGNYNLKSRVVGGGTCSTSYVSNPVVISVPTNGTVGGTVNSDITVCTGVNTGILTLTGHTGDVLRWESSIDNFSTTTNISNTTTSYTFNNLSSLTKYRAVVKNGACDIANASPATISVLTPFAPSVANAAVSNGNSIALIGTNCSASNSTLRWFKTADNSQVTMPITPTVNTQYYAKCELTSGNTTCPSDKSNDAMVLVIPKDLIYVNVNATGSIQDGASWETPMGDLQTALSFSENGTSIWITEGIYKPTPTPDRSMSFNIPSGVKLYGGFAGTETTLQERGTNVETILSGDIGEENDPSDNSYHVATIIDAAVSPILDKLTIKDGYASNQPLSFSSDIASKSTITMSAGGASIYTERGGGIYIKNSSPLITNCRIQNNAGTSGGGIYAEANSVPNFKFSIISGNTATLGGGLYNQNSNTLIDNSLITGNKSFGGAAMYNKTSNTILNNVTIAGNDCIVGNIFNVTSTPMIKNSIIWNNTGGMDNLSTITYSIVENGFAGISNLDKDPKFVASQFPTVAPTTAGDYHVMYGAPGVDAGENGSISLTDLDLDGKLRRYDGATVDMGAYELIGNFDTANSGSWGTNTTWKCNCIPDGSLPVRIMGNHEVIIPDGMTGQAKGLKFVADGKLLPLGTGSINIIK